MIGSDRYEMVWVLCACERKRVPVLKLIFTVWESVFADAVLCTTSFILTLTVPVEALPKVTPSVGIRKRQTVCRTTRETITIHNHNWCHGVLVGAIIAITHDSWHGLRPGPALPEICDNSQPRDNNSLTLQLQRHCGISSIGGSAKSTTV